MTQQPLVSSCPATLTPTPPRTQGLPLLGSLPWLLLSPVEYLLKARETYGDIYTLNLGPVSVIILNNADQAQHILADNSRNYYKGSTFWESARTLVGDGVVASDGEFWLRQRRMLQPHFHRKRLNDITGLMIEAIEEGLVSWEVGANSGRPFDVMPAFNHVAMKVMVRTMFGSNIAREESDGVGEAMAFALDYIFSGMIAAKLPRWVPFPGVRRYRNAIQNIDTQLYRLIERWRQSSGSMNNLLSFFMDMIDEETGEQMTDKQLRDELVTAFIAGYETTAATLAWAIDMLTRHPAVMEKLLREIETVLGDRPPTLADLRSLNYTRMVIHETLRLRPAAWWLPRDVRDADEIDGYRIPAGSTVVALIYAIHRNPTHWENPDQFDPERFANEAAEQRHKYAWIPFGMGQRICLGRDFALLEAQLVLAMVLQRYRIKALPGFIAHQQLSTTMRPRPGVNVFLERRARNAER